MSSLAESMRARFAAYKRTQLRAVAAERTLAKELEPEHKTHAKAGAIGAGGRWTPFRRTIEQLARAVEEEPGITLKAAIEDIRHHYSSTRSARVALAHWIDRGKVPGVRLENARLFPTEVKTR